ncbi:MAG: IMPACT family protein [Oscillospiraceae bacterium]|jgi:uncharacterized YigZ family protein|nr:IMPACT family protein [Oscillospiraceae bacterium]
MSGENQVGAEYKTVRRAAHDEFTEKKSRFIGFIKPVKTEEEALSFIAEIRSEYWDARHCVYAYRLREGNIFRFSDDGEPSGSAGMPTLGVLTKSEVTDAAVAVVRYFGGVLLGTGGLVRAYSRAAALAVECGEAVVMRMCDTYSILCGYGRYTPVSTLISDCGGVIDKTEFLEQVEIIFHIAPSLLPNFRQKLADATNAEVKENYISSEYYEFSE